MSKHRRLREDDEDRVIVPTFVDKESDLNLLQMARNVEKRKQAKAEARRKEEERAKYREKYAGLLNKVEEAERVDDKMDILFNELVPASGKADTKAGELVRAMMRIMYRDYNDGDIFYAGYGKETAGGSAAFLAANVDDAMANIIENIVDKDYIDLNYTSALEIMAEHLIDFLIENPELFEEPNEEDSRDYDAYDLFDNAKRHEFECDFGDLVYNILNGYVDNDKLVDNALADIEDWLDDFVQQHSEDGEVNHWARDAYSITNLDIIELEEVEREWDRFARDLDDYLEGEYDFEEEDEEEDW